jgi:hypothetical protein
VGPRPESPRYVAYYTPAEREVLRVKPGITGLTQVRFRHEETLLQGCANLEEEYVRNIMPQKLQLDLEYIRRRSLLLDLEIIVQTFACLLSPMQEVSNMQAQTDHADCQLAKLSLTSEGLAPVPAGSLSRRIKLAARRHLRPGTERRLRAAFNSLANWLFRASGRAQRPPTPVSLPTDRLQAGDPVRVRHEEDIVATLNHWRQLRGCAFMPEMVRYCGTSQRVLKPMHRFVDERDLRVKRCRGIVLLEGVMCQGTADFGPCDRSCHLFWREEWLEKIG